MHHIINFHGTTRQQAHITGDAPLMLCREKLRERPGLIFTHQTWSGLRIVVTAGKEPVQELHGRGAHRVEQP